MINRENYLAVQDFLTYQTEVMQLDASSVSVKRSWLNHLLRWADDAHLTRANALRPVFPQYLTSSAPMTKGGKRLASAGVKDACDYARAFLTWARENLRNMRAIDPQWIGTIRPPRLAGQARKERQLVTIEHMRAMLATPADGDDLMTRRDRAAACFLFLTGIRAAAFCSLSLACVDMAELTVKQYPELGVRTKNQKAILTRMFDIPELLAVVSDWDAYLRERFPASAPWYPAIIHPKPSSAYRVSPVFSNTRTSLLRLNLMRLFADAGLPALSPHKYRHGNATYGLKQAKTIGDLKSVSMNLGHSSIGITDSIYAVLSDTDMQAAIGQLGKRPAEGEGAPPAAAQTADVAAIVEATLKRLGVTGTAPAPAAHPKPRRRKKGE